MVAVSRLQEDDLDECDHILGPIPGKLWVVSECFKIVGIWEEQTDKGGLNSAEIHF